MESLYNLVSQPNENQILFFFAFFIDLANYFISTKIIMDQYFFLKHMNGPILILGLLDDQVHQFKIDHYMKHLV